MATATKTRPAKSKTRPTKVETFLLVMVLDRSGSMSSCHQSTVDGFNAFLHDQQREKRTGAAMTLVQFDAGPSRPFCQTAYTAVPLHDVADLGSPGNPYSPAGGTPLFDAVGQTVRATERVADAYDHVLFIVLTDGFENASQEWNQETVYRLVGEKRDRDGWDFIFMGANIDAYDISATMNVPIHNTVSYDSGFQSDAAFASLTASASAYRGSSGGTRGLIGAIPDAPFARPNAPAPITAPRKTRAKAVKPSREAPSWLR